MKKISIIMISLLMLASCQPGTRNAKVPAFDTGNLDTSVKPGDDFYRYATHGWQEKNPLKPEYSRFGSFDQLNENNVIRLNDLFSSMSTMKTTPGSVEQKIVDLYKQGLDSVRRNNEGAEPLKPYLAQVYAAPDKEELARVIATMHASGCSPFFSCGVEADLRDSDNQILYMSEGGLGIGDRDYYLKESNAAIKEGYRNFLCRIFTLAGIGEAADAADDALFVEDVLAENSWTREQNRDYIAQYNPFSTAQITACSYHDPATTSEKPLVDASGSGHPWDLHRKVTA